MPSVDQFIQYGCLGLIALLFVWTLWKGIPQILNGHNTALAAQQANFKIMLEMAMDNHKQVVAQLINKFEVEAAECRKERQEMAKQAAVDRDTDREIRHKLGNQFTEVISKIVVPKDYKPPGTQ